MDGSRFDDLAKTLVSGSRRSVVKGIAGGVLGGVLGFAGLGGAEAKPKCRKAGQTCKRNRECCEDLFCAESGRKKEKRCTGCPSGSVIHQGECCTPTTCEAEGQTCGTLVTCGVTLTCGGCGGCCEGNECLGGSDPSACGAGGGDCQLCPSGSNAEATCDGGNCGLVCLPGFADCNGDLSDGCETLIDSDTSNCGGCGISCDDGNPCTIETCAGNLCLYDSVVCEQPDACTFAYCDPALGCVYQPVICDDNNLCTYDACDVVNGCVYTEITCDGGDICTSAYCDPTVGCVYTPIDCDDQVACTNDYCDMQTGCVHVPDDNLCPPHPLASCLAPLCTGAGCDYRDLCDATHPDCDGCAECSCNVQLSRCVKTCPS